MRWTESLFGLKRLQCRKGVEDRQPAVWDDQIPEPASLFQALGRIVQNGQIRILFHISIGADQSELFDERDVAL
jgi:hypothetical protein